MMPIITGTNGNDNLSGTAGSDTINPLLGRDTVDGLGDSDTLIVDYSSASVDPYAGASIANVPSVISSNGGSFSGAVKTVDGGNYVTFSNIEHLQVKLDFWHNTFILDGSALALGATIVLDGGTGTDTLEANLSALASVDLHYAPGSLTASFGTIVSFEVFKLTLTSGADTVTTGGGHDTLTGNGGDDVLNSGGGNDILSGGTGSNILNSGDGDDTIASTGIDIVDGGSGGFNFDRWSGDYGSSTANLTFIRDTAAGTGTLSNGTTLSGIESITALTTGSGDDRFTFTTPEGYIEQFLIAAGAGEDSLTFAGNGFSGLISADGAGAFAGNLGYDRFSGIEHLSFVSGSFADSIIVNAAPLLAGATLVLDGAGGVDWIAIDFTAFGGITFVVAADATATANVAVTLSNFEQYQITSGAGDDNITTGSGDDVVRTNGGNDIINAAGGNDLLDGGSGADAMAGGNGNDICIVDDAGDTVAESAGEGIDEVRTSLASYSLTDNVENLAGTAGSGQSLTGNGGANTITGGIGSDHILGLSGNDFIDGRGGADAMEGGHGDDVCIVDNAGDVVVERADEGNDVVYTLVSYQLTGGSHVELLSALDNGATSALALIGNEFANTIYGNNGANFIDGNAGADALAGFGGNDAYVVDNVADRVFEDAGRGNDIVYARASFALGGGSEIETLAAQDNSATTALALVGNEFANTIFGNNGANYIDGNAGADALAGFGGNDAYVVDNVADRVFEDVGRGNDTVYATASFALGGGSEIETLAARDANSTDAINLVGNEFANTIVGNNGANTLNGGSGNDVLRGFGGADTFAFTTTLGAGNVETILDFSAADDTIALDDAMFTGLGLGTLNPNAFVIGTQAGDANDRIIYNSATGQLLFDADGNGAGAAIQFATLTGAPALTATDFTVI